MLHNLGCFFFFLGTLNFCSLMVDLNFNLRSDRRRILSQSLACLIPCLFIAYVAPKSSF
jgi:hypothetical protein